MTHSPQRALAVLAECLLTASTYNAAHNTSSTESGTIFWPPRAPGMHSVHLHTCKQSTQTHNKHKLKRKLL